VPLSSGLTFKAYPGSYGTSNGVRMTGSQWTNFTGHCGHQHVPENLHGDPGAFPIAAILAAAKNGTTQEDDVALTDADIKKIAATTPRTSSGTLQTHVQDQTAKGRATLALVTAQKATIDELVKAVATLASNVGDLDPAAIVTELKSAIESIDVHLDVTP
jgi:hypothetical protein